MEPPSIDRGFHLHGVDGHDCRCAESWRSRRPDRPRPIGPSTIPAVETYAPGSSGVFEVISVQASNRIVRLRANDGKTGDVSVAEHVYDLSKLKAGDKLKVDFLLADEANPKLSAAGIWPAE